MPELVPVRVRDCACPDSPHDEGDVVYLHPTLSLRGGIAATQDYQAVLSSKMTPAEMTRELTARWLEDFVRYGYAGSNIEPFDVETLLADYALAEPVSEKANDLYYEAVLSPLGLSRPQTSPRGRTGGSTSPTKRSTRKTPSSS